MAPISSTVARASKKMRNSDGIRSPSNAKTPSAKAMSVAMGMPHPFAPSSPRVKTRYSAAGRTIPPTAPNTGKAAFFHVFSSPWRNSRLISKPTAKKKIVMNPPLTQCSKVSERPMNPRSRDMDILLRSV